MKKKTVERKIGLNKGVTRIWLEGKLLSQFGWSKGEAFTPQFNEGKITYNKTEGGSRKVAGTPERPIIDTNSAKIGKLIGLCPISIQNGQHLFLGR